MAENSVAKGVFLECLEPYILSDKLVGMTAQIMKDLLLHFQDKNLMANLEACIVHMDITSLDIQQVIVIVLLSSLNMRNIFKILFYSVLYRFTCDCNFSKESGTQKRLLRLPTSAIII